MNDSVREELSTSLAPVSGQLKAEIKTQERTHVVPGPSLPEKREAVLQTPAMVARRNVTTDLAAPKTSPTLVDFQNKNTTMPEWRLQVQNAVRQRVGATNENLQSKSEAPIGRAPLMSRGAAALKAEPMAISEAISVAEDADPRLSAALARIADSRKAFLSSERASKQTVKPAPKNFPFNVVSPSPNSVPSPTVATPTPQERLRPAMVAPLRMEKRLDTNKLPLIETVVSETKVDGNPMVEKVKTEPRYLEFSEVNRIHITADNHDIEPTEFTQYDDEIEDLAPFSMRFNAGLFDLIIGVFAGMIVLSPIALTGGNWFTVAGVLTFVGTCALILFTYFTVSIGFFGKTIGMRLFSLELVDAEQNEYPTIHQAAVSSSLYILSLALGGAGFISVFFNEEKRAVHDLLSGTIIVREF